MIELFLVFLVFGFVGALMVVVNKILGPRKTNPTKEMPYECGSPPLQEGINPFPIKYYLVAFLFLLFDIEVVFLFPWALVFKEVGMTGVILMFAYIFILLMGFIYAWKKGAFQWEK
ncbi:MAG: NAD(P)H-quinone oxidoreductase subunit 3 [Candidatus Aminicenantes bacterium]|nr:NAD(P)H-quinone oxidoreductase subunit 3 [Candidatus Aminicenantes bacterium]